MNEQKIAILTDSGSDVPEEVIQKHNIKVIPLKIIFKDGEYIDKETITAEEVYERLEEETPKTSLPDGAAIEKILDEIKAEGYEKVIAVTISSGLSGTNNMVKLIAEDYEGLDIFVVDTKNIGIGSGLIAVEAANLIEKNTPWNLLKDKIAEQIEKATVYFHVPTLEYLQKGGRIGLVAGIVGSVLNLKPIISCNEEGIYYTVAKVRGAKKSLAKTVDLATEFVGNAKNYRLGVAYGGNKAKEEALKVVEDLKQRLPHFENIFVDQVSPALGVHTGPGLIGIGVHVLDED